MPSKRRKFIKAASVAGISGLAGCTNNILGGSASGSTGYAVDPVRFIVPFGPGGGVDRSTRQIQSYFEENLGVKIKPEYKSGAGTQIGTQAVLNAKPDVGTIGAASIPAFNFTMIVGGAKYSLDDFAWIGNLLRDPGLIRKHREDDRFDNIQEVVKYAKENPGELKVSTSGPYNQNVLGLALLEKVTGAKFNIVPYDGGSASRGALVKEEVDLVHANVFNSLGTSDSTEVLAVHAKENEWSKLTDDAPTFSDALGFDQSKVPPTAPQVRYAWFTQAKAAEDYPDRIKALRSAFKDAIQSEEYVQSLKEKNPPIDSQVYYKNAEKTGAMNKEKHSQLKDYISLMEDAVNK
ncbi:Bug family tripartite tricarboxylate transporter substrate binding protein [Halorussus salinisoli]|uniref:Bug family tripartite tricarboxylate transporter substrate binding protein n=1 Tax=Halorussus salinisoli TaxID=2558242 RepID=UPI0010C1CF3A|nr:tripartite tricarboxylate transporter substrate-binding protein [Halorussus salinisoli]